MIREILEACAKHINNQLKHVSIPAKTRFDVQMKEDELEVLVISVDEHCEIADVRSASFGVLEHIDMPTLGQPVPEARLELWSRAFLRAQLDDEPALTQAGPALLFRAELTTEADMLGAMRDPDYALWAEQILEESGPDLSPRERCERAVRSGNALWVDDLVTAHPELLKPGDEEPLLHLAAQECISPEYERVFETLLQHGAQTDAKDSFGQTAADLATPAALAILAKTESTS
ncbi:MAG: hypothetical protein Q8O67_33860 [Deltaproteobacteria bacterium]|nr:hypothetical protein [Deltaproteobacteria bacterium]